MTATLANLGVRLCKDLEELRAEKARIQLQKQAKQDLLNTIQNNLGSLYQVQPTTFYTQQASLHDSGRATVAATFWRVHPPTVQLDGSCPAPIYSIIHSVLSAACIQRGFKLVIATTALLVTSFLQEKILT